MGSFKVKGAIASDGHRYVALFQTEGSPPEGADGQVSASRRPDHSFYPISEIASHNGNGPSFSYAEGARELINRVMSDVDAVINDGAHPQSDPAYMERGEIWPKDGIKDGAVVGEQPKPKKPEAVEIVYEEEQDFDLPSTFAPGWATDVIKSLSDDDESAESVK